MMMLIQGTAITGEDGYNLVVLKDLCVEIFDDNHNYLVTFCLTSVSYNFFEVTGFEREPTVGNAECKSGGEGWGLGGMVR